jgi:N-acetylglucosaminyl-diphospho-decaprenol L-rhamnosyltransferase
VNTPRLGIAIVHFHAEELLARCIEHLQASRMADFQVCIVDCGSRRALSPLLPDRRFELLEPRENLGFAAASNLAFRHLPETCPWLLTLNPDVLVEAETLGQVLDELQVDDALAAMTCRLELPSGRIDPACRRAEPTVPAALAKFSGLQFLFPQSRRLGRYNLTWLDSNKAHDIDAASGAFLMMRRSALQAAGGGFDERFFLYGEDLDLCRRLRQAGYRLRYTPATRALHTKGSGRVRSLPAIIHFHHAMWLYYRKWGAHRNNPLVLAPLWLGLIVMAGAAMLLSPFKRLMTARRDRTGP